MWIETIVLRKEATNPNQAICGLISNSETEILTNDSGSHDPTDCLPVPVPPVHINYPAYPGFGTIRWMISICTRGPNTSEAPMPPLPVRIRRNCSREPVSVSSPVGR